MSNYIVSDTNLTAVAEAIRTKGGTSSPLEFPSEFVSAINSIPSGGSSVANKDVNFYDYDGTLVASYSAADFANLAAMPDNPTHAGLTAQGWNWSLSNAKTYVASYGKLNIGQMYVTDDGKTRLYIHIADSHRMDVPLYWNQTVANGVTIDWGDGSAAETFSGTGSKNTTHSYSAVGDYVITLSPATGNTMVLGDSYNSCFGLKKVYLDMLFKVEYGIRVTSIANSSFSACYYLKSVTIPSGITYIGSSAFSACYSLKSVTIPNGITTIGSGAFASCRHLESAIIPKGVTGLGNTIFNNCVFLKSITIPNSVSTIGINAFAGCMAFESITIPNSVTSIGTTAFNSCGSLKSITIPSSVTSIGTGVFGSCYSLESATIANGITSIPNGTFGTCNALESITIPNSVTDIDSGAFANCYSLESVTMPSGLTNINSTAFSGCEGMATYDFSACTSVPTLANINAFNSIPSDCKMLIPTSLYSTWSTADKWSTYASYMVAV